MVYRLLPVTEVSNCISEDMNFFVYINKFPVPKTWDTGAKEETVYLYNYVLCFALYLIYSIRSLLEMVSLIEFFYKVLVPTIIDHCSQQCREMYSILVIQTWVPFLLS